jgi:cytochrome b involved in lipid metabolism
MKNYISISLFIFWAVLVSIMTAGLVFNNNQAQTPAPLASNNQTGSTTSDTIKSDTTGTTKTPVKTVTPPTGTVVQVKVPPASTNPVTVPPASTPITLSLTEVAKHNTQADCWQIINGNVYNFTTYLRSHPGGVREMTPYCGKDATAAYASRGGTGTHSGSANGLLPDYIIGQLNQTVSASQTPVLSTNTPAVVSGEYEDEEDD